MGGNGLSRPGGNLGVIVTLNLPVIEVLVAEVHVGCYPSSHHARSTKYGVSKNKGTFKEEYRVDIGSHRGKQGYISGLGLGPLSGIP